MQGEDMLSGSSNNLQETFSEGANDKNTKVIGKSRKY